ncbi:kinase-like domain-containing protein [Lentinula edodes]|nr:kinase-like domain-containing protein [Lentinula edodes]
MDAVERENLDRQKRWAKEQKVGEGAYAVVYRGREFSTGRRVAIKKIKVGQFKDGLDMSAIREVKYLRELKHRNVIELLDVFSNKTNLNLVLEFLDSDLEMIIKDRSLVFLPADIKSWMAMTFRGLEFCHRNFILHRDLKPNNLLIASDGHLKIADFGLARDFADPGFKMTCQVITRWYRPPELLFGARYYSSAVDIWSVGCIFAELMLRTPYLAGESDMDQLKTIFRALGTPTEQEWPGHTKLPDYVPVGQFPKTPLRDLFTAASTDTLNLLSKCLLYEPRKRVSAAEALQHPYFYAIPHPTHPLKLPKCTTQMAPRPLGEVDGDGNVDVDEVDMTGSGVKSGPGAKSGLGPGVKSGAPNNTNKGRLKRKITSPMEGADGDMSARTRSIARKLDFTKERYVKSP